MAFTFRLSSGVFGLPSHAQSVDWLVLKNSASQQLLRVSVFACPIGAAKHQLAPAPGPIDVTLDARHTTHNANSVGAGQPFQPGMPIEIVVDVNDLKMLPTIEVWEDMGAAIIPGTRIGPRDFVRLK